MWASSMPSTAECRLAERQANVGVGSNDVFVRAAKVTDAAALIKLNEEFRENMLRWQQEDDDAEYPVLDFDDVEFILTEEDNQNLIVLCEKPSGGRRQARIIGYSYAYDEPWEAHEAAKKDKGNGKGKRKDENTSLYIAEVVIHASTCQQALVSAEKRAARTPTRDSSLFQQAGPTLSCINLSQSGLTIAWSCAQMFVAKSERGRGLGDVLLFETLNRRCKTFPRSHLYVSSRNTTAVAIYNKFGFVQSDKPSGDISHDLVRMQARMQARIS